MVRPVVSFANELETSTSKSFKTWPLRAIKQKDFQSSKFGVTRSTDVATLVTDIYNRYEKLNDDNSEACLRYIVEGNCKDSLISYSVLNTILKTTRLIDSEEEQPTTGTDLQLESLSIISLIKRSCDDFDKISQSDNVLDFRVLQQIIRSIEGLWTRSKHLKFELEAEFKAFVLRCIKLIRDRPGSKLILSPAVRISNVALEDQLLGSDDLQELVISLSKTHFAFAASFSVEVILVFSSIQRTQPAVLRKTMESWIPFVMRSLTSNSGVARNLALQLLSQYDFNDQIALALREPCDPKNPESEPLIKFMMRKLLSMSNSQSQDDLKFANQSWCLVLKSATHSSASEEWPFLDQWVEVERSIFQAAPKTITNAWETIIEAQRYHKSYCKALVAPFMALSGSVELPVDKLLAEAVAAVDCNQLLVWESLLYPVFKILSHRRDSGLLTTWANMPMELKESRMQEYLEVLSILVKHATQQNMPAFEALWKKIVQCGAESRSKAMEVVKFHYHLLGQENFPANSITLPLTATNTILKTWSLNILTERPKNSSFSLLTLVLLPIMVFVPSNKQTEYLDHVLANSKSESMLRSILASLLHTVHTGGENQLVKWSIANSAIREYIGSNEDQASGLLCQEALLTFLNYQAESSYWVEWRSLFVAGSSGRDKVMASLNKVPIHGLATVLSISGYNSDKVRILTSTFPSCTSKEVSTFISTVKDANLPIEVIDHAARSLINQKTLAAANCAFELVTPKRAFVIAKPLLSIIDDLRHHDLINFWNSTIVNTLGEAPAFVSRIHALKLARELPKLIVPQAIVIPHTQASVPTPPKRHKPFMETPPSASKRPRRNILVGSVPPPLSTPPVSSDSLEDVDSSSSRDDLLCSSPPPRQSRGMSTPPKSQSQTWRNSQERARTLKRVMMGLDMDEAVQDMKRSEQEMIYNLMFRSCVKLRTHLAATSARIPSEEVESATEELKSAITKCNMLNEKENMMIENGKRRLELGTTLDDEEYDEDEDEDDGDYDSRMVKLEVA